MLKFGLELEGFFDSGKGFDFIAPPPKDYPTDGFPGLVEFRSTGANSLHEAYSQVLVEIIKHPNVLTSEFEHTFSPESRAELRRRHEVKSAWDIRNLYGKNPRALGNKTIASLQINISNSTSSEYRDKDGTVHPERFGLLDVPKIILNLDEEFQEEIKEAKRQAGEYCIKDGRRLEYRSLPNFVFPTNPQAAKTFLERIEKCVE